MRRRCAQLIRARIPLPGQLDRIQNLPSLSPPAIVLMWNARVTQTSPPPSFSQPDGPLKANSSYSASFYQSAPFRVNRDSIVGAQYQLMSRGYYRRALMVSTEVRWRLPCKRFNRAPDFRRLGVWTRRRWKPLGHLMRTSRSCRQYLAATKPGCR